MVSDSCKNAIPVFKGALLSYLVGHANLEVRHNNLEWVVSKLVSVLRTLLYRIGRTSDIGTSLIAYLV